MPEQTRVTTPTTNVDIEYQALQETILSLEKKLSTATTETHTPKVDVSVADMNQMYSNHLATIDFMFTIVASFIVVIGFGLTFIGYRTFKGMIEQKITEVTEKQTKEAIKASQEIIKLESQKSINSAIAPLEKQYKAIIERQNEQEIKLKVEHHLSQAYRYAEDTNYQKGLENFSKVIKIDQDNEDAYAGRAFTYNKLKENRKALDDYTKAIQINPKDYRYYNNRAATYTHLTQYEKSLEDLNLAEKLAPNKPSVRYNKACLYALMKKPAKDTLLLLEKAILTDEKYIEIAQKDDDFISLRKNKQFRKLVGLDDKN